MSFNRNRKEGNVLFNDALNTFYLRLYGLGHIDNKRGVMLLVNEAFSALTKYQGYSAVKSYNHRTSFTSRLFFLSFTFGGR